MLKQRNLTLDEFKRDIRRQLTETKLINKEIESKINITDAQIADFYEQHKADFNVVEPQYHLAQIVVTTAPAQQARNLQDNKATSDADAKKKIEALYSRLESGAGFCDGGDELLRGSDAPPQAAATWDSCQSRSCKSDPEVYNAISKLKPDQFTDVLPVYDSGPAHKIAGYAIYKLISREPAGQRLLSDPNVRQTIHQTLHDAQKQMLQNAYLETLQDDARVRNLLAEQILKQGEQ